MLNFPSLPFSLQEQWSMANRFAENKHMQYCQALILCTFPQKCLSAHLGHLPILY